MEHIIKINDHSQAGKSLLELARVLAKTNKGVHVVSKAGVEEVDDPELLKLMKEGRNSGRSSRKEVMQILNGILEK